MTIIFQLANQYPKTKKATRASTGWIPMDVFEQHEREIRSVFNGEYRVIYRGPRVSNKVSKRDIPSMTMRCDATHAVIYRK